MWYAPTDSATLNDDAALKPLAFSSLTGEQVLALLLTWAPVLAATLLALVLRRWLTPPQTVTAPGLRTRVSWLVVPAASAPATGAEMGAREGSQQPRMPP